MAVVVSKLDDLSTMKTTALDKINIAALSLCFRYLLDAENPHFVPGPKNTDQ